MTTTVLNTKNSEVENKILNKYEYVTTRGFDKQQTILQQDESKLT